MIGSTITAHNLIHYELIAKELSGGVKKDLLKELSEIVQYYENYKKGVDFTPEGSHSDYEPSDLKYKNSKSIIDKEARFLFAHPPDITISVGEMDSDAEKADSSAYQNLVDTVIKVNKVNEKLVKSAKDCFIAKRIAIILNFNEVSGIDVAFVNALQFIYEMSAMDPDELSMICAFIPIVESSDMNETRIFRKKYWMENGYCYLSESIHDGSGNLIEDIVDGARTEFEYIPAVVILNDGLVGDTRGESEMESLQDYEKYYSKLGNADKDAERKSMNPIKYTIDASNRSTDNLHTSPGSFWDLSTDQTMADGKTAQVGNLESNMSYSTALKTTLDRIKSSMYEQVDVPHISVETLQGVVTSGKALKSIYWPLIVRCDEKAITWIAALEFVVRTIIDGSRLFPDIAAGYTSDAIPVSEFDVTVMNNYPLLEDEAEEKEIDMAEVSAEVMSKKTYMMKWRKLTDKEADIELKQIALERELLDNSFGNETSFNLEEQ